MPGKIVGARGAFPGFFGSGQGVAERPGRQEAPLTLALSPPAGRGNPAWRNWMIVKLGLFFFAASYREWR